MGRFVLVNANVYFKLILSPRWASSLCAAKFQLVKKLEMECILSLNNNLLRLTPESCTSTFSIISIFYDKSYNWFRRQSIWHDIVSVQYSDVIISVLASLITGVSLFTQPFVQAQMKKTSKPRVTGLCEGNSAVTGEFSTQRASNAKNVSIWWRKCIWMNNN